MAIERKYRFTFAVQRLESLVILSFTFRKENINAGNRGSLPDQDASRLAREVGDLGERR
jgi:hypothetical protein